MESPEQMLTVPNDSRARPFRLIMVATDLSGRDEPLIELASSFARAFHSSIVVVTVSNVPTSVKGNETDGLPATLEERKATESLRRLLDRYFGENSDRIDLRVLHGDPAGRVVEYADYIETDLILIGSRGQGALRRAVQGSVSESVVARSNKPVLVLK